MLWILIGSAYALPTVIEELSGGHIDWTRLELVAGAEGHPPGGAILSWEAMEGQARAALGPRMLDLTRYIRIDAEHLGGDLLDQSNRVADRLRENLSMWEVFKVDYFTSGSVDIEGALSLHAWLRPALVEMAKGKERTGPPTGAITGLVVDARGIALKPAIAPAIKSAKGEVLYNIDGATSMAMAQRSPVIYVTDPADPFGVARAGEQPLFIHAIGASEGVDLTVSDTDFSIIQQRSQESPFLLHGNVVIVVSQ